MRRAMAEALDWWEGQDEALNPMEDVKGNPYEVADFEEAAALEEEADDLFAAAVRDDNIGDKFELSTVLFALTLFFGGISTVFRRAAVSRALLGVAAVTLFIGLIQLSLAFLA